jgi:hypothetical protein
MRLAGRLNEVVRGPGAGEGQLQARGAAGSRRTPGCGAEACFPGRRHEKRRIEEQRAALHRQIAGPPAPGVARFGRQPIEQIGDR